MRTKIKLNKIVLIFIVCFLIAFLILTMLDKSNSGKKKDRMERNHAISFFVIDSLKYQNFQKRMSNHIDSAVVSDMVAELSYALQNDKHAFTELNDLDFGEVNKLYTTHYNDEPKDGAKKNLLYFLNSLKEKINSLDSVDINFLLDFYFYYSCVVTFNKDWFLQPHMPISLKLSEGLKNHTLIMKQIIQRSYITNNITPLYVNNIDTGYYYKLSINASEELFSNLLYFPVISKNNPRNVEVTYFNQIATLLSHKPSYVLCVFYTPD